MAAGWMSLSSSCRKSRTVGRRGKVEGTGCIESKLASELHFVSLWLRCAETNCRVTLDQARAVQLKLCNDGRTKRTVRAQGAKPRTGLT